MSRWLVGSLALVAAAPLLAGAAAAADSTLLVASCADGSVVLAAKWEDVHCAGAIRVPREHVPGVGSERDRAAAVRRAGEREREHDLDAQLAHAAARARATPGSHAAVFTLAPSEVAGLVQLLALGTAPSAALIERERRDGSTERMRLAHSRWLDARLRHGTTGIGAGPVLVFRYVPSPGPTDAPMPAFGQRGVTFRPDAGDLTQMGWIAERGAVLRAGAPRLGYVVLPAGFDATRPLAVFWGDAVVATRPWRGN